MYDYKESIETYQSLRQDLSVARRAVSEAKAAEELALRSAASAMASTWPVGSKVVHAERVCRVHAHLPEENQILIVTDQDEFAFRKVDPVCTRRVVGDEPEYIHVFGASLARGKVGVIMTEVLRRGIASLANVVVRCAGAGKRVLLLSTREDVRSMVDRVATHEHAISDGLNLVDRSRFKVVTLFSSEKLQNTKAISNTLIDLSFSGWTPDVVLVEGADLIWRHPSKRKDVIADLGRLASENNSFVLASVHVDVSDPTSRSAVADWASEASVAWGVTRDDQASVLDPRNYDARETTEVAGFSTVP
jgi:hypothetical protein